MAALTDKVSSSKTGGFAWELTRAQDDLYIYITALTGRAEEARDILQETNLTLCREAEKYDPRRSFMAWARAVAYYQILTWRKKQSRERLVFDDAMLENFAGELNQGPDVPHVWLDALEVCLAKLPARMRALFEARYADGMNVKRLAAEVGRAPNAVAVTLFRIRQTLCACVEKAVMGGEDT